MDRTQLDGRWKEWLRENIERRCDPEELFCTLVKSGFSLHSIREAMGDYDPTRLPLTALASRKSESVDYKAIAGTRLTRPEKTPMARRFPSDLAQLYTLDDFLSSEECDAVVTLIRANLRPSTITNADKELDKYFRTSGTCDLGLLESAAIEDVDQKICRTLGIRAPYSEDIQGHLYAIGQEFKAHTDFFQPGSDEYAEHCSMSGNGTWTFMVYLNDVPKGGGTHFVRLGHIFQPRKGQALIWNNLGENGVPNYDVVHAGLPVEEGYKAILTKWFRERGAGPMLFDD